MIDHTTPVSLPMGQLITGVIAIFLGVWGVTTWVTSGVTSDVSAIRQSVEKYADKAQTADKDSLVRLHDAETKLSDQIAGLRTDLAGFKGSLDQNSKLVASLSNQVEGMQKQLSAQQVSFNDPKAAETFATALKNAGIDGGKIIIVPWGGLSFQK